MNGSLRNTKKWSLFGTPGMKSTHSCLHHAEFHNGVWVGKIGNILKHVPASWCVQLLEMTRLNIRASLYTSVIMIHLPCPGSGIWNKVS